MNLKNKGKDSNEKSEALTNEYLKKKVETNKCFLCCTLQVYRKRKRTIADKVFY